MKQLLTGGWNFMRVLRLVMSVPALFYGITNNDVLLWIAGGFLFIMSVFNIGCSGGTCYTNTQAGRNNNAANKNNSVVYEKL
jgi:ABC-type Co2+ transport system permease subunit